MFHKEGYKIILTTIIVLGISILVLDKTITTRWLYITIASCLIVFCFLIIQFFRNPKRYTIRNDEHIIAPVDGKVVVVEEVFEEEFFKDKRIQVSIFMSPLNVHVTRYPVGGTTVYSKYHPGSYLVAWHPKASKENERTTVVVENKSFGSILHRQIAGAVARRIVNYAQKGKQAIQGADSGFIKFGSRVDVFLPLDANIKVKLDEKVRGGETVIATK